MRTTTKRENFRVTICFPEQHKMFRKELSIHCWNCFTFSIY